MRLIFPDGSSLQATRGGGVLKSNEVGVFGSHVTRLGAALYLDQLMSRYNSVGVQPSQSHPP